MEDSKEKILRDWNAAMDKDRGHKFDNIEDLYRRVLAISRNSGKRTMGSARKDAKVSDEKSRRATGKMFTKTFGREYAEVAGATTFKMRQRSQNEGSGLRQLMRLVVDILRRIRKLKSQKH